MHITDELLCAYIDNELDAAERVELERALAQDAALRTKLASWTAETTSLRNAFYAELDEPVPEAWVRTVRDAPAAETRAGAGPNRLPWLERFTQWLPSPRFAAGMAVAVIVGVFVGKDIVPRFDMDGQLVRLASVAHHVYSPDKRQPVEVKSEDPTLVSWISKRLGTKVFAPSVNGFRFMGGRLLAGAEEPAGQFMYEDASGKRVTVFVRTEGARNRSDAPECGSYRGVSVCYWYAGDVAYALAGEVPQADLAALVQPAAASVRAAKP